MARLLLRLEAESFADARACPFCHAETNDGETEGLPHEAGCELDTVLRAAGLRGA